MNSFKSHNISLLHFKKFERFFLRSIAINSYIIKSHKTNLMLIWITIVIIMNEIPTIYCLATTSEDSSPIAIARMETSWYLHSQTSSIWWWKTKFNKISTKSSQPWSRKLQGVRWPLVGSRIEGIISLWRYFARKRMKERVSWMLKSFFDLSLKDDGWIKRFNNLVYLDEQNND